jgi:membrane-associated phospholipid phosphatase
LQVLKLIEVYTAIHLPDPIRQLDYKLFALANGQWHSPFFDGFFPFVREPFVWAPFYFFLLLLATINFKKKGWYWTLFLLMTASISDIVSSRIIKENFLRLRPCHDPQVADSIRFLVNYCPVSSSFTSSHAVNHFAVAMFIFTTFKTVLSPKWAFIFLWASAIAYAQVYVGVHFPIDVICGSMLGLAIGYIPAKLFNARIGLSPG